MSVERVKPVAVVSSSSTGVNITSGPIAIGGLQCFAIQAIWASLDAADGTIKFQMSLDGTNWSDYPASSVTMTAASDSVVWDFPVGSACVYGRVAYTKNSVTTGTLVVNAMLTEEVSP